jgi:hypothetical protein
MKTSRKKEIREWVEAALTLLIFMAVWIAIYMFMWTSDKHYPG